MGILIALMFLAASSYGSIAFSLPSKDLLGIAPQDEIYYKSATIKCRDGSNTFSNSQLNDDFCDCIDGTDEPGTSACPNGKFYCRNAGHAPLLLYSSRVNDGICDCCDGSDEYDGKAKCLDTCWEAGKVARDKLKKKIGTYQEGVRIRKRGIEQAKLALSKDEVELVKLKSEAKVLKGLVEQLKERKEQIEKTEEKERLKKEKEKREADEAKLRGNKTEEKPDNVEQTMTVTDDDKLGLVDDPSSHDGIGTLKETPLIQDDHDHSHDHSIDELVHSDNSRNEGSSNMELEQSATKNDEEYAIADSSVDTGSKGEDASENTEALSREELGRLVASRWTGERTGEKTEGVDAAEDTDHENDEVTTKEDHDEEFNGYDSEIEDDHQNYDDGIDNQTEDFEKEDHDDSNTSYKAESDDDSDISDLTSTSNPSWLEKIQRKARSIFQSINIFQAAVNISEGAHVRKEYDESSAKLSKMQSRISSLMQKLKHDFGPDKEFYSLYGQCFETKQNKYVYKVCPFKEATQEEGYSTTHLGKWDKFEDSYRTMQFSNGGKCWNGPDRSLKVKLRCGLKDEITDVDEPSRCEYLAVFSTPALCVEEKLKELQSKLDLMSKEQPQGRDEL